MAVVGTQKHALAELIDAVRRANSWSDEDVAARARSRGHDLSKSNISRIRNSQVVSLNVAQVRALADGLGLPTSQVVQAALTSMGLSVSEISSSVQHAVRADPELSERDRELILALLNAMRHSPNAASEAQQTAALEADLSAKLKEAEGTVKPLHPRKKTRQ